MKTLGHQHGDGAAEPQTHRRLLRGDDAAGQANFVSFFKAHFINGPSKEQIKIEIFPTGRPSRPVRGTLGEGEPLREDLPACVGGLGADQSPRNPDARPFGGLCEA